MAGKFERGNSYLYGYNQRFYNKNCDQDWNFGTGLFPIGQNFQMKETYFWWHAIVMDSLKGPLFTHLATINDSMTKIVTKTEILALVSLLLGTYFIWYWLTFGDILTDNNLLILILQTRSLSISTHSVKQFLRPKQSNVVVATWACWCIIMGQL